MKLVATKHHHFSLPTALQQHHRTTAAEAQLQQFRKETDFRETDTGDGHVIGNRDSTFRRLIHEGIRIHRESQREDVVILDSKL